MNPATIAATTAAALSFVGVIINVFWSYRLTSRARLEEWRRSEELPVVAQIVKLSREFTDQWQSAALARIPLSASPSRAHEDTEAKRLARVFRPVATELLDKLRFEVAQLDLTAGTALRHAATGLLQTHLELYASLIAPADGSLESITGQWIREEYAKINKLRWELVERLVRTLA